MRRALMGLVLALAGAVAVQAQCTVSKSSIDFGNVNVGTNSPQVLTVSVAAGFPGPVNFSFQAAPTVFSVSPQSVIGVPAGQSRDVTVTFTPNGAGQVQGEVLVNTSSQFNCPVSPTNAVILTGTGVAAGAPYTISPKPLNFGNVVAGSSRTLPITVAVPSGQNPLDFSFQVTGAGFGTSDPLAFSLTPGLSQTINITFTATTSGAFTGALQGTAGSAPVFVSLQANVVPAFTLSPTSLALGDVLLGCSASQTAQVIPNATLSFSLTSDTSFFTVAPTAFITGVTQAVQVRFTPNTVGSTKGAISVAATLNESPVPGSALSLTGRGFDVVPNTAAVDFGSVPVGGASNQTVTLATAPVTAATLLFSATSDNPAFTVTMNGNQAQITFRPDAVGGASGTLTFTITRTDRGFTPCVVTRAVSVRGAGVSLGLTLNPTSVDFGAVSVGTTSPNKNVSLNSTSTVAFTGTVTSSNPAFLVSPASFSLSAGGAQAFTLNFRPPATGAASGTLTFSLTSSSLSALVVQTSLTLPVTGTGQAPVTLTVTPTALDFGDVTVGLAASRTVTVTNTGQAPGAVTATPSTPTVTVSPSSFNLNGGASQQVVIGFLPATSGSLQARVDFAGGDTTVSLGLSGRGVIPTFSYTFVAGQNNTPVSPGGSIGLPTTPVGSSNAVDFQIRNSGTVTGTVGRIVASGGAFSLPAPPTLPATLAPGETLTVRVSFQPATPGPATGSLTVDNNQVFTLSGVGLVRRVTFTGASSVPPRTQQTIGFQLADRPTTPLTGTLTLEFVPNALGGDDQMIAFPNGLRRIDVTVPANSDLSTFTGGVNQIGFQTGTVAGIITFRLTLQAGGVDVTPSPAPVQIFTVARAGPVIVGTPTIANRTATAFQVVVVGFATSREVNTATFRFNASGTGSLQTPALTVNVNTAYTDFYNTIAADPNPTRATNANLYGGQFTLTVPFTVTGDLAAIRSVTVTLSNGDGTSAAVDVSF